MGLVQCPDGGLVCVHDPDINMSALNTHYGDPAVLTQEEAEATHPGFTITCHRCGSTKVYVESSLGFSAQSGSWGSIDMTCFTCKASTDLFGE